MKVTPPRLAHLSLIISGLTLTSMIASAAPESEEDLKDPSLQERERDGRSRSGPGSSSNRSDPFQKLSAEEREQLREAVRRAWSDPAVIEARDKLKNAAEDYQNALNASIKRISPGLADTIESLRRDSDSSLRIYGPGPGPGGKGGDSGGGSRDWRDYEGFLTMENPSFLNDLSPEQQSLYRSAHTKAINSPTVKARLSSLRALRETDDEIRKQRIEGIRQVHQAIRQALVEADPQVEAFLPEPRRPGSEGPSSSRDRESSDRRPRPEPPAR